MIRRGPPSPIKGKELRFKKQGIYNFNSTFEAEINVCALTSYLGIILLPWRESSRLYNDVQIQSHK